MEQSFDLWKDRIRRNDVPLLVIGLGGAGAEAVKAIRRKFAENFMLPKDEKGQELPSPSRTGWLVFDTDPMGGLDFAPDEFVELSLSGPVRLTSFEKTWIDEGLSDLLPNIHRYSCRQFARLQLSRSIDRVYAAVREKFKAVMKGLPPDDAARLEIVVVTGIGGNTGSGIFLDLCQILRRAGKEMFRISPRMTGYILLPEVVLDRFPHVDQPGIPIRRNAFAALWELDFWMRFREHKTPYSMRYGTGEDGPVIEWKFPPFDVCALLSSRNSKGIPDKDGPGMVMETIAESLMHLFSANISTSDDAIPYRAYEDILPALISSNPEKGPLFAGYRTFGILKKRIPRRAMICYEGSLLLKTFMPPRDDSGSLQPDRRMLTDGQGRQRAEEIVGKGSQLLLDFQTCVCPLPKLCHVDLTLLDKVKLALLLSQLQSMKPPAHFQSYTWRSTFCSPIALEAAERYLEKAWRRFEDWAASVITDPGQGPFALEACLDSSEGLIADLEKTLDSWTCRYREIRNQRISESEHMCRDAWPALLNPPLLGKKGVLEKYFNALKKLYTDVNTCEFLEKHTAALEKLILRVREYLRDGLKPLCGSLLSLEKEFSSRDESDAMPVQDLCSLSSLQAGIDQTFMEANENDSLSVKFLRRMAEISLKSEPDMDRRTSGVSFLCCRTGPGDLHRVLWEELDECFGAVNCRSVDDILMDEAGGNDAAKQKWVVDQLSSAMNSTFTMFPKNPARREDRKIPHYRIWIPCSDKIFFSHARAAVGNFHQSMTLLSGPQDGQIFIIRYEDGISLYQYGLFEELYNDFMKGVWKDTGLYLKCIEEVYGGPSGPIRSTP